MLAETVDPVTNIAVGEITGRFMFLFLPGDQGPFGQVAEPALIRLVGHSRYTFDIDNNLVTAFSLSGVATDLCALIASP